MAIVEPSALPSPTSDTSSTASLPAIASPGLMPLLLHGGLMLSLGLLTLGVAVYDYRQGQDFPFLRVQCLVAEIAAGVGMAFCFGGAMHFVDGVLEWRSESGKRVAWYWRIFLLTLKRLLLVGQIAGAAIVVLAAGALIFDKPIPGSDWSLPERIWSAPEGMVI